jgi:hypothetical protein
MYSNYHSLKQSIDKEIAGQSSVLNKFPDQIGRPIVQACAKHLAQYTSSQLPFSMPFKSSPNDTIVSSMKDSISTSGNQTGSLTTAVADTNEKSNIIDLDTVEQVNWTLEVSCS